jgi:SH3-like domain-containing protein
VVNTQNPNPFPYGARLCALLLVAVSLLIGCGRDGGNENAEHGYVVGPQVALRDRVAAVYNKVGLVNNGDKVRVLDRSQNKRFVKVRTVDGKEGWMEQRYLVGQEVFDGFAKLAREHANSPAQAVALTRRVVNMHVLPARNGEALYKLKEGTKVELLERTMTPRSGIKKNVAQTDTDSEKQKDRDEEEDVPKTATSVAKNPPLANASADPLEDWWLVRDADKRAGWLLGRMLDVDIPLEIAQYAEGQRIIAAFVLNEVSESPQSEKKVPQYAVLMSEPKDGLPFDFNQVRVFTWNPKKTRYETAYRERLLGELPFQVGAENFDKEGKLPTFIVRAKDASGAVQERKYKMNGPIVRRVVPAAPKAAVPTAAVAKPTG